MQNTKQTLTTISSISFLGVVRLLLGATWLWIVMVVLLVGGASLSVGALPVGIIYDPKDLGLIATILSTAIILWAIADIFHTPIGIISSVVVAIHIKKENINKAVWLEVGLYLFALSLKWWFILTNPYGLFSWILD